MRCGVRANHPSTWRRQSAGLQVANRPYNVNAYRCVPYSAFVFAWIAFLSGQAVARTSYSLEFIGQAVFETGFQYQGTQVGGLSGIDYDAVADRYFVLSDDRSSSSPRFYTLEIDLSDGALNDGDVVFSGVTFIKDTDGASFAPNSTDPEAIRYNPDSGKLYWASEGNAKKVIKPFIRGMTIDGAYDGSTVFSVPNRYLPTGNNSSGIRNNLAFESLTLSADRETLYAATENALIQDGPAANLTHGGSVRVLQLDLATGEPQAEYIYEIDPVPSALIPVGFFRANGLVELLALNDAEFLAIERAFSIGVGNTIKLFKTSIAGASDVSRIDSIVGESIDAMRKDLLLDLDVLGIALDNIEGVTLGPALPNGRQSLILVSDNNFSLTQVTQFLAFEIIEEAAAPVPASLMLIGLGIAALAWARMKKINGPSS